MARTIEQIEAQIIQRVNASPLLTAVLTSTSLVAIWRLWVTVTATVIHSLEALFDFHRAEVIEIINSKDPHSTRWYAEISKKFQFGYDLVPEEDFYDNTGLTEQQISDSLIVKHSAVVKQRGRLRIKVARLVNGDLAPLTVEQLQAFTEYMERVTDAGVDMLIESLPPDSLKLKLKVFYNPLVLSETGARLDGVNSTPVQSAVNEYLKQLPFNGKLVLANLIDHLQDIDGVEIPHVVSAQATFGTVPYSSFDVQYLPDGGYLRILQPNDLEIEFIAQTQAA